jgi:pyruvate kinase
MRKTKIVATIGPASESLDMLQELLKSGLNVARLNFSHGDHAEQGERIARLRQAEQQTGHKVALLLDTKGPEIRSGILKEDAVQLEKGNTLILTTEQIEGDANRISVSYAGLTEDVKPGGKILIDDGLIEVEVEKVEGNDIITRILNGGLLKSRKGINVPGVAVNLPGITEKDAADIRFGLTQNIDYIAASFVRKANDVHEIRELLEIDGKLDVQIIAKIENQEGIDNLEEILDVADGIMVARGDLGVEVPPEEVPHMQKMMIKKCNERGKPVITATQMLDSMERNPRPTRAEVTDVANAILDGTDAIMLSGETAAGIYPIEALQMMATIAERTETEMELQNKNGRQERNKRQTTITDAISQAVCNVSSDLGASAVITATESGFTAKMISKYRPSAPIIAVTPNEKVLRKLSLVWGVQPLLAKTASSTDEMFEVSVDAAVRSGLVNYGDLVVVTAGVPVHESGTTNLLKIHVIGDVVAKGQGVGKTIVSGEVVVARNGQEALSKIKKGAILVTSNTDSDMMRAFEQASAVITEEGGLTSHAAIVGISLGIPVIVGVEGATHTFIDGKQVTVDAVRGHIYSGHAKIL